MKKLILILVSILLCISLVSCEDFDLKAFVKRYLSEDGEVSRDAGYIETKKNDAYEYEVYEDHVLLTEYLGEESVVRVPDTVDSLPVTVIGSLCFYYSDDITVIVIPDGVKRMDSSAVYHCEKLVSISLPESLTLLGERCFAWCTSLQTVVLPSGITEIPDYCFNYCTSLQTLTIPEGVTRIGDRAFSWCLSLQSLNVPKSVETIGEYCFYLASGLTRVYMGDSVKRMGSAVFEGCESVKVIAPIHSECAAYCALNMVPCYRSEAEAAASEQTENSDESDVSDEDSGETPAE